MDGVNGFQCIAKTKELTLLFQYVGMGTEGEVLSVHLCILISSAFSFSRNKEHVPYSSPFSIIRTHPTLMNLLNCLSLPYSEFSKASLWF